MPSKRLRGLFSGHLGPSRGARKPILGAFVPIQGARSPILAAFGPIQGSSDVYVGALGAHPGCSEAYFWDFWAHPGCSEPYFGPNHPSWGDSGLDQGAWRPIFEGAEAYFGAFVAHPGGSYPYFAGFRAHPEGLRGLFWGLFHRWGSEAYQAALRPISKINLLHFHFVNFDSSLKCQNLSL